MYSLLFLLLFMENAEIKNLKLNIMGVVTSLPLTLSTGVLRGKGGSITPPPPYHNKIQRWFVSNFKPVIYK